MRSREIYEETGKKPPGNTSDKIRPQKEVFNTIDNSSYVFLSDCKDALISDHDDDAEKNNVIYAEQQPIAEVSRKDQDQ